MILSNMKLAYIHIQIGAYFFVQVHNNEALRCDNNSL